MFTIVSAIAAGIALYAICGTVERRDIDEN